VSKPRRQRKPSPSGRPATEVLTAGFDPRLSVGSVRPAVFRSSTYVFRSPESAERAFAVASGRAVRRPGEDVDLIYSRMSHPNAEILEEQILPLEEGAKASAVFNSGLSALASAFFRYLRPGDAILFTEPLYGGTLHMIHDILVPFGVKAVPVPASDTAGMTAAILSTENLKFVLVETPANPTLTMADIGAAVRAARKRKDRPVVAVDNTFMGPVFQHPLALGADLSIYSATKFLAGFSDMLGGVVIGRDPEAVRSIKGIRSMLGTILQPDECWILGSRLATVALRMNKQSKNAERIVEGLKGNRRIARIHYPTCIEDREQRRIYRAQCDFPGALFSLEVKGGKKAAFNLLRNLGIIKSAVSLGGMESLACHPASTTHSSMTAEEMAASGVSPGLVRFSVGLEDWRDLLADVERALAAR
jgi:methionine-gamma-lyase